MSEEEWRPVVGYEAYYEVSDHGRVRSFARVSDAKNRWGKMQRHFPAKVLKTRSANRKNYDQASLCVNGFKKHIFVQYLVMDAFVGPRPDGMLVCHRDDNKQNNHVSNLYYGSWDDNGGDRIKNGTQVHGESFKGSKLTETQVMEIVALAGKVPQRKLGKRYGVSQRCICSILHGQSWSRLTGRVAA